MLFFRKKKVCCICGNELKGYGNDPTGAMMRDNNGIIELSFKPGEKCCDECNMNYVVPGRVYKYMRGR